MLVFGSRFSRFADGPKAADLCCSESRASLAGDGGRLYTGGSYELSVACVLFFSAMMYLK